MPAGQRDVAVIDVGSNSVRLVQFRLQGRALWPVFNEKASAGLGRGASQSGRLHPEGVETAMRALKRFSVLLDAKGITDRRAVATAAVRDCVDGPDFVARAAAETGFEIEILSGEEEGRRSALGVLSGVGEAHGLTGDLGGSSLELTRLEGRKVGQAQSLSLGPLAVGVEDLKQARAAIKAGLQTASDALASSGATFYAVGGAWRAFAQLAMAIDDDYPLRMLHQYTLSRREAEAVAAFALSQSPQSLALIDGVSERRAAVLPYAALLLQKILKRGQFDKVVISTNGLREGVVCHGDISLVEVGDPLIAGAEALAAQSGPEAGLGQALHRWLDPVFCEQPDLFSRSRDAVLRAAACRLADIGARLHPDHRADLSTTQILYAPFGGVTHTERALLALTIFHRYAGKRQRPDDCAARRLLDDESEQAAMALGLALRLGAALCGRSARVLDAFSLSRTDTHLILGVAPDAEALVVERALNRFEQLASTLGLEAQVRTVR
jgi:exopolyphosphatase/guanosine-5'-triphosphate,3'-diphosphate pyrophosphatase